MVVYTAIREYAKGCNMNDDKKGLTKGVKIAIGILVAFLLLMIVAATSGGDSSSPEAAETTKPDEIVASIKENAKDGECSYDADGAAIASVEAMYSRMIGQFVGLGKEIFEGDTCNSFRYTVMADSRSGDSKIMAMMLNITKDQYNAYQWEGLEGQPIYDQLDKDGIIEQMNKVNIDTDKIRLGSIE